MEIGIKSAKSELSRLIKAALAGEKVVITNHGQPLVRLVPEPIKPKHSNRGYGSLKDILNLPPGWDSIEAEEGFCTNGIVVAVSGRSSYNVTRMQGTRSTRLCDYQG